VGGGEARSGCARRDISALEPRVLGTSAGARSAGA
jgi:hypothetical protein